MTCSLNGSTLGCPEKDTRCGACVSFRIWPQSVGGLSAGDGEGAALLSVLQQHAVVRIMLLELLHLTGKACLWLLLPTIPCCLFFHF